MSDKPDTVKTVNQVSTGAGKPLQIPPPAADNEFLGSPANNPFRNANRKQSTPSNPFKNSFEPEG